MFWEGLVKVYKALIRLVGGTSIPLLMSIQKLEDFSLSLFTVIKLLLYKTLE